MSGAPNGSNPGQPAMTDELRAWMQARQEFPSHVPLGRKEEQAEEEKEEEARRVSYKRSRPVKELILEAQEKQGYRANAAVRIVGLQNAAHLNGCRGRLQYHVSESGRWQVALEDGPEAGQSKALKPDNLEPLDAPKRLAPTQKSFKVGDRAEIRGLETRPELNGRTCLLLAAEASRWKVMLEGTSEEKLMKPKHLHPIEESIGGAASTFAPPTIGTRQAERPLYSIAGSWDNWTPVQMDWDEERRCYTFNAVLGSRGFENFLMLRDGDWKQCLHPDRANACPYIDYVLCGPDNSGQQVKSWAIGRHPNDQGTVGARYEVRLSLTDDNRAGQVDWLRLFTPQESAMASLPTAVSGQPAPPGPGVAQVNAAAAPKPKAKAPQATLQDVLKAVFEEVKAKSGQLFEAEPAWECVGGADKGGILVREGEELSSPQAKDRLATGAIVKQRALKGERLNYEILRGKGPTSGWVSIKFKEKDGKVKDLMVVTDKAPRPALKDRDLVNLQDKFAKAKVKTLTDLLTMLRDLGTTGFNERLKAASQRSLPAQVLERLKHFAEAAEQGAAVGGAAAGGGAAGLPDPQLPAQRFEVVHEIAMVRAEPATNAKALGRRLKGESVSGVEETFDGFVRLEGDQGWVVKDMKGKLGVGKLLAPSGGEPRLACSEVADQPGPKRFEVVYKTVAVRDKPSVAGKILGAKSLGEFVEADMQSYHGWIRLAEGAGWMLSWKEDLGQLLKPAPPAPKGPRIISAPIQQDDELDDIALWAQQEVAKRKGRPMPDPAEQTRKRKEAEEKERQTQEAARKAAQEEEKRLRDQETSKKMMAEARRQEAEAQQRRAAEEAEAERRRQEDASRAEEEARRSEEARLEAERRRQQQEAKRREEEAARRREEDERRRREEEDRQREQELRRQQEAEEARRREEELARAKGGPAEAAQGGSGGEQGHDQLLARFREAVLSGDAAQIKSTRDAAKKGGVPVKDIGRTYAAAQEERGVAG